MNQLVDCDHIGECQMVKLHRLSSSNGSDTFGLLSHTLQKIVAIGTEDELRNFRKPHIRNSVYEEGDRWDGLS